MSDLEKNEQFESIELAALNDIENVNPLEIKESVFSAPEKIDENDRLYSACRCTGNCGGSYHLTNNCRCTGGCGSSSGHK